MKNILVILSSETQLPLKDGKTHATGFYLNEFGVPAHRLVQEGYTLTVATPRGNRPAMDAGSDVKDFFKSEEEHQSIKAFVTDLLDRGVVKLSDAAADLSKFDAVFLPGGHAPMIELMRDADLGRVLEHFHARSLPTALICHAPAALLAAQPDAADFQAALQRGETPASKGFLYDGYKVTVFANTEEQDAEKGFEAPMQYYPADALNAAGALVLNGDKYSSHVVRDRELITGQNPMSDEEFVEVFLKALDEQAAQA
ncbi:type 1 glutamine amidotransferase domain-containing protein [Deinococcus aquiradiocola]|uniref:Type 1 glutamine amidotransferase domain-containing protein n=1 Tax=Deinococcus aquiradiocola TaxID=393059 RepID=A0A917PBR2_9DEIO|nr:type 1 glutamine amidotransferase domain-containing protein [Deinococcus aquiradiocola]GGJ69739.1 type 1 glutamine amidotransferase domain-containing protein [Deinococcus aquiradiocola]